MKTNTFIILFSLILFNKTFAQNPDTLWTKVLTGFKGNSVSQITDGGYIIGGLTSPVNGKSLLIKTNSSGDTTWTKSYDLFGAAQFRSVMQTNDGGFIATGETHISPEDILLVKTDSMGEVIWSKTYGGTRVDWASDVKQTFDEGYIIVGSNGSYMFPSQYLWLLKTDSSGDTLWTRYFKNETVYNVGLSVCQARDSGYVFTGYTILSSGSIDAWIIKTNQNGELIWAKTYGGTNWDQGNYIQQTTDDGYIIVGRTESFGSGYSDVWLIKTDSNGDTLWTHIYGGMDFDEGNEVQQTFDNGYVIVGTTEPFGPGNTDLLLIKTDSNGNTIWTSTYGGADEDQGFSVKQTTDHGYIVSGQTYSNGSQGKNVWLLKISSDPAEVNEGSNLYVKDFKLYQNYPNPFNPATIIKFALPVDSRVKINIYNSLGQLVETLADQEMESGYHEVNFDASRYSSGVYLYQLQAGEYVSVKKMLLIK